MRIAITGTGLLCPAGLGPQPAFEAMLAGAPGLAGPIPDFDPGPYLGARGIRHFEKGSFESAAKELMEVWTAAPTYRDVTKPLSKSYLFLGMKFYSEERYDEAIRIWEKILAVDPGNVKAQRYLQKTREEVSRLSGVAR